MELSFSKPFAEMRYHEFVYTTAPSIPFTHCFTTRLGGVSEDYLDSLNLGENRGDKPQNVVENYRILREAMRTAGCAFIARVATQVAMALGASVQPLTKMTPSVKMTVMSSAGLSAICPMNQLKVKLDHAPVRFFCFLSETSISARTLK